MGNAGPGNENNGQNSTGGKATDRAKSGLHVTKNQKHRESNSKVKTILTF